MEGELPWLSLDTLTPSENGRGTLQMCNSIQHHLKLETSLTPERVGFGMVLVKLCNPSLCNPELQLRYIRTDVLTQDLNGTENIC